MAYGLPAVVTDIPENVEAIGDAGFAVPWGDETTLAATLRRLAENEDERTELGVRARSRVEAHFDAETMISRTRVVYEDVLAERGRGSSSHLTAHLSRRLSTNPISRSTAPGGTVRGASPPAAFQPLIRDRTATVSREIASPRWRRATSVTRARATARLLRMPQRRRRKPRAQPPDSRARRERWPLVAERRWTATAAGAATVVQPRERRRSARSMSAP